MSLDVIHDNSSATNGGGGASDRAQWLAQGNDGLQPPNRSILGVPCGIAAAVTPNSVAAGAQAVE